MNNLYLPFFLQSRLQLFMVELWDWGHRRDCTCGVCSSLRRLCVKVARFSVIPQFREFIVQRSRNFIGELDDWVDFHLSPPDLAREGRPQTEGTAPPSCGGTAEGQDQKDIVEESPKAEEKTLDTSRQTSASLPTGPLGLRAVPKSTATSSSAREVSSSRKKEEAERPTATEEGGTTGKISGEPEQRTPKSEKKKDKDRKEKKRSRSRRRTKSSRHRETKERKGRSKSPIRIRERADLQATPSISERSPSHQKGDNEEKPCEEVKEEKEESEGVPETPNPATEREERDETRRTDKPPEPDHPPSYRYRQEIAGLGEQWRGPIRAPEEEERDQRRSNKGTKKRETQRNFKEYKKEHGHGLGFYRPRKY